jgi:hypothetical protein
MTYWGLRNRSPAFAFTLRVRGGQNHLQIRPCAILRDKKLSAKGTDNDYSQQREYSKQNRPHGGLSYDHKVGAPVPAGSHPCAGVYMLMKVNPSRSFNVTEAAAATSPAQCVKSRAPICAQS